MKIKKYNSYYIFNQSVVNTAGIYILNFYTSGKIGYTYIYVEHYQSHYLKKKNSNKKKISSYIHFILLNSNIFNQWGSRPYLSCFYKYAYTLLCVCNDRKPTSQWEIHVRNIYRNIIPETPPHLCQDFLSTEFLNQCKWYFSKYWSFKYNFSWCSSHLWR